MSTPSRYAAQHANPAGAGDSRPTAIQIVQDEDMVGKLTGKTILITGCSSGIGVETARALHHTGADLFLTVRDVPKGQEVVDDILATSPGKGKITLLKLELDSFQSVRAAAAEFLQKSQRLNILINNAGIMACPESKTRDGHELQFGTNHLGHFLLFILLKPLLLKSSTPEFQSRVVSVSSMAHRNSGIHFGDLDLKKVGYTPWLAYGQSKTANIYFSNEIERRYGSTTPGIHSTSLMPGGIATPLQRHLDAQFRESMMTNTAILPYMKSPEQGAATTVWAAIGKEWEGKGGKYLEDCAVALPKDDNDKRGLVPGYAPWAYDEEAEKKLWEVSLELVGEKDV